MQFLIELVCNYTVVCHVLNVFVKLAHTEVPWLGGRGG